MYNQTNVLEQLKTTLIGAKKEFRICFGVGNGSLKQSQSTFKILNAKIDQKKK
jgi:hypothetical protein